DKRWPRETRHGQLLQGALFGAVIVLGMLRPLVLGPGLIFDGRSVMLSICALYFGPWTAVVAGCFALICRVLLGGMGILTGSLVIASSLALGLAAHYRWKPSLTAPGAGKLILLGLAVHAAMLALMLTLPGNAGLIVIKRIGLPILLLFPLATVLAGKILSDHLLMTQAASALLESESRYKIIFEASMDAVLVGTPDGRILTANPAACRLLGYSEEELIALGRAGVTDREDPRLAAALEEWTRTGNFYGELTLIRKGQVKFPAELTISSFTDRFGQTNAGMIIRDITERRREEEHLKKLQALLVETQRLSKIGGWEYDPTTGRNQWTHEVFAIYGVSPDTRVSREKAMDFYAPEDRPVIDTAFRRLLETGEPYDLELKFNKASGERIRVRTSGQAEWRDGKIVRVFGNIMDITERLQTEEALRDSETLFRDLFMRHEAVKLILDPETGDIIDANNAAEEFYGWPREQLLKMKIFDINTLTQTEVRTALQTVKNQKRTRFQFRHRRADGSIRDVEVFSSRIDVKGKPLLHSIITDISERKAAENRMLQINEELEQKVQERTAELKKTIAQLEETNRVFVGRELKMTQLKKRIEELEKKWQNSDNT
ncbi:MAG TPA: PAS domain S-box protein, partial [Smithellaceae bacterium]|nr:PAS domain S-box protein [Smithellaceae bacterium]